MNIIKKLAMSLAALVTIIAPVAAQSFPDVRIESQLNVRNTTTNTNYAKTTDAKVDEVVAIQVWYHNKEADNSGLVANNLKVKINMPTTPGKVQTVSSTVSAANSNTVNDSATVNLSVENATLEYIPGSAEWRHNAGTNDQVNYVTEKISDAVVTSGVGLVLENAKPCFNFEATVTILARVKASTVSIVKQVRVFDNAKARNQQPNKFVVENNAKAGETLEYLFIIKNEGNTVLKGVQVGDNMPPYLTYVNGSTLLVNSLTGSTPKALGDGITTGGITIDEMNPGSTQYVYFKVKLADNIPCGPHRLKNVGLVRAIGTNQIFNVAFTNVNTVCVQTPPPPVTPPVTPPAPVTPAPLPETGAASAAAGVLGSGALGYAVHYYRRSKQSLINALKR